MSFIFHLYKKYNLLKNNFKCQNILFAFFAEYINPDPIVGYIYIYPAMTAFTDQYSLPNNFFDIGQL
jgi:hypothetical protein